MLACSTAIIVYENTKLYALNALKIIQDKILRIMLSSDIYTPVSELYRAVDFLNLDNISEIEFTKFYASSLTSTIVRNF